MGIKRTVHQLFMDVRTAYDSVKGEVLFKLLFSLVSPWNHIKLAGQIKTCLNETYIRVRVGKHLSDLFPIMNVLKQGDAFRKVQTNYEILQLSVTHHILAAYLL
jgi:hypothetical protein